MKRKTEKIPNDKFTVIYVGEQLMSVDRDTSKVRNIGRRAGGDTTSNRNRAEEQIRKTGRTVCTGENVLVSGRVSRKTI